LEFIKKKKRQLRIADVQAEIEIEHPQRTSLKRLPLHQPIPIGQILRVEKSDSCRSMNEL
jgi:hypothetical protein